MDLYGKFGWLMAGVLIYRVVSAAPRKTDPNTACDRPGSPLWAFIHDTLAHPLMGLTGFSKASLRFHNWTSHKAWPRKPKAETRKYVAESYNLDAIQALRATMKADGYATVLTAIPGKPYKLERLL